jgi:hypothetical protein
MFWIDIRRSNRAKTPYVTFLLMTPSPGNKASARRLLEHLMGVTGAELVTVIMRGDPWFFQECSAPPLFFFGNSPIRLPTEAEYRSGREASCGNLSGSIGCLMWPDGK